MQSGLKLIDGRGGRSGGGRGGHSGGGRGGGRGGFNSASKMSKRPMKQRLYISKKNMIELIIEWQGRGGGKKTAAVN
jgi:hypothetical protein